MRLQRYNIFHILCKNSLNLTQVYFLFLILDNSEIKMSEMAEKLAVTTRTIEREMKKLREFGRVERVGGKRYGHWEVK